MPSLAQTCDHILASIEGHEFGIPTLWPLAASFTAKPALESEYYDTNAELARKLDRLVYLNKRKLLRLQDAAAIDAQYKEMVNDELLKDLPENDLEQFLVDQLRLKRDVVLRDVLPAALPILRAIHVDNAALTELECSILNNLKKLYSRYNSHPGNIRRLVGQYQLKIATTDAKLQLMASVDRLLAEEVAPRIDALRSANEEYASLNTIYESANAPTDETRAFAEDVSTLSRRLQTISVLSDLLPALVLCHPSNWYNDKSLRDIMEKCQSAGSLPELKAACPQELDVHELLLIDIPTITDV